MPPAIYSIPPQSPAYNVTDVEVTESTGDEIEYTWTDAYEDGVYVAYGTPWYGTGWYYPPFIYGLIYYPYWGSYGHGSWYNPVTGRYGSRSVWRGNSRRTVRTSDGRNATVIEGSGGGEAITVSRPDDSRLTVAESGGGDVYAGYNGNIYKKMGEGWQRLDNGTWKPAGSSPYVERERPLPPKVPPIVAAPSAPASSTPAAAAQGAPANERALAEQRASENRERALAERRANEDREREQLDRDYEARERGDRQFRQRAAQRGGSSRRR